MSERPHHRPMTPGDRFFETVDGGADPAQARAAADRAARLLVRGAQASGDAAVADRLLHLADTEGIETIAEAWSGAASDTLAGCLWRLYLLRQWVWADPVGAARQFDAGRRRAPVAEVVAGVAEPPGPEELKSMVDAVLRGIVGGDFADVLLRAAAFARVVATGRADLAEQRGAPMARMLTLSEQLEQAAHLELREPLV